MPGLLEGLQMGLKRASVPAGPGATSPSAAYCGAPVVVPPVGLVLPLDRSPIGGAQKT